MVPLNSEEWQQWLKKIRGYSSPGDVGTGGEECGDVEEHNAGDSPGSSNSANGEVMSRAVWPGLTSNVNGFVKGMIMKGKSASWAPLSTGIAIVTSLVLLLLLYQIGPLYHSGPAADAQILEALQYNTDFINAPNFDCSTALNLKGTKMVVERQHYHPFPADPELQNACQSKFQQHCFRKNTQPEHFPPPKFLSLLRRYEAYHEKCTKNQPLTALGIAGDTPPGCKYLVWKPLDGMGNQLLSLVCAFVYSLLTDRVMLIDTNSHIDSFICNPFPSSSWILPPDFPETALRVRAKRVGVYLNETLAAVQRNSTCNIIPPSDLPSFIAAAPKHLHAFIICCDAKRDHQFFCPTAQKLFSGANWFFYLSHEYTLPGFYFIPEFRDKLNDWFPRHDVFMHVSRYLLNPHNDLWENISGFYKDHMDGVEKVVGIQPRSWRGEYNPSISKQIARCAVDEKLLPKTLPGAKKAANVETMEKDGRHTNITVLVTSLRGEYRDVLASEYTDHPNVGDLVVDVLSASSEGIQKTGDMEHDAKAIIDIWLLSFAHDLVTTPYSTFGSTASGLAGIVPLLFVNYGNDKVQEPACARTNAGGPCFIVYPSSQPCDLDPPRSSIFAPDQKVPEVKFCDFNPGLGIVTASD
ncbi:hypothetical protein L7F22_034389 [Adiantum nelumboides]|nr:hypothetical protein [Adiantum nelumboides]